MSQLYTVAYNVQASGGVPSFSPDEVAAVLFGFGFASIILAIGCALTWKRNKKSLLIIPILAVGVIGYLSLDAWDRKASASELAAGKVKVVQGCIENFNTNRGESYPSKSSFKDETWDVGGEHFGYKVTSNAPGYHEREVRGGVVHEGQYLRVSYIVSPILKRQEIMKIEIGSERCK